MDAQIHTHAIDATIMIITACCLGSLLQLDMEAAFMVCTITYVHVSQGLHDPIHPIRQTL